MKSVILTEVRPRRILRAYNSGETMAMLRILMGLVALGLLAIPAQAADLDYGYRTSYSGVPYGGPFHGLPVCEDGSVLARVTDKFAYYDGHGLVGSTVTLSELIGREPHHAIDVLQRYQLK